MLKKYGLKLTEYSIENPKTIIRSSIVLSIALIIIAALPSISPSTFSFLKPLTVDTDPENMLPHDEPARVFHDQMKKEFSLHEMIVVGVTNKTHKDGVFNPQTLKRVYELTQLSKKMKGVISIDLMAPSTVDDIKQQGLGAVSFDWLMKEVPKNSQEALSIKERALRIPMLRDTLIASDGKALAIYLPIKSKKLSFSIYSQLQDKIEEFEKSGDEFHVAGLPVAEDVFGVEMFMQMAIAAPAAMLIIFLLLFFFFRNIALIASALIIAFVAVVWTMSLLVISGNTVHIMSSMIPIFIMPIAVLDAIHILSEFFDHYKKGCDRKKLLREVVGTLFTPMAFTTLTTMAGFVSLSLTPIPPVQVFGVFVGLGVFFAWLLTMMFIPAYIVLLKEESLQNFGLEQSSGGALSGFLQSLGRFSQANYRLVLAAFILLAGTSYIGLQKIQINDNPTKWFQKSHPIRVADQAMNQHMAGTYMSYLTFHAGEADTFKDPQVLAYLEKLQSYIDTLEVVGKSTSVIDIVKTVHRDLFLGNEEKFTIPSSQAAVAQVLLTFQNGHRPQDLWHFVNSDYDKFNFWLQMKSGDNKQMAAVVAKVDDYIKNNPPPKKSSHHWFGLTYINKIWQDKMVSGMLKAFLGSFAIVLLMMIFLFRSVFWGVLSMIPLSLTILMIYGLIGWIGKDYDMPVAVLSSLSLGLAIDYAIHFLARSREMLSSSAKEWSNVSVRMFAEPARAIFRNIIVVGLGFFPLVISPLVPYKTVGVLIASILLLAGVASLVVLPALICFFERFSFFSKTLNSRGDM